MNIGSGNGYPSSALSNFSPHKFEIDGVECASMEGFLQSLKFKGVEIQENICTLVGLAAKRRGKDKNWKVTQTLWWRGVEIDRHSKEYQELLDRAFDCLSKNDGFLRAIIAAGDATFTHSIGKSNPRDTVLTTSEFCSRLNKIRAKLRSE